MHRKDGSINANMASDMNRFILSRKTWHGRNGFMIATLHAHATHHREIHGMAGQPTVRRHVCEAIHGKSKFIGCMEH